jgi:S-ribosylhomocysteine lyase LuxS involved in autoinducer biosynthesis
MKFHIEVDFRHPKTKEEKIHFGQTWRDDGVIKVFINRRKNPNNSRELPKTIVHELIHAVFFMIRNRRKSQREESICRVTEEAFAAALRWI